MSSLLSGFVRRLQVSLLSLRIGVFVVMFVWALDKFVNPAHSAGIFEAFYGIGGISHALVYLMGGLQIMLVLFLAGVFKTWTYGFKCMVIVPSLIIHLMSTIFSQP